MMTNGIKSASIDVGKSDIERLREALTAERKARHMSLRALSSIIGCGKSALSDFEKGSVKTKIETVFAYAKAMEIAVEIKFERSPRLFDPTEINES